MRLTQNKDSDKRLLHVLLLLIPFSFLISCHSHKSRPNRAAVTTASVNGNDEFATQLQTALKPVDTTHRIAIKDISDNIRYVYQLSEYQPVWESGNKASKDVKLFLDELEELRWDGLDPERYNLSGLKKLQDQLNDKTDVNGVISIDTAFTHSYLAAAGDLLLGAVLPRAADSLWFHKNDSIWNAPRLLANSDKYPTLNDYRSTVPTYLLLRDEYKRYSDLSDSQQLKTAIAQLQNNAVVGKHDSATQDAVNTIIKTEVPWAQTEPNDSVSEPRQLLQWYQNYAGIAPTGKLDSNTLAHLAMQPQQLMQLLQLNMERVRWMQKNIGDLYIVVNIPMMELFFRKDGENVMHMRTVVGKPERQTPALDAAMANVVINPPWGVPPTILKKDVLPGITKSGQKYLTQKGLSAYNHSGKKVSASGINADNYKRYTYSRTRVMTMHWDM
jgi:murein L,D-transpeptidase YcbB/YkuD